MIFDWDRKNIFLENTGLIKLNFRNISQAFVNKKHYMSNRSIKYAGKSAVAGRSYTTQN